MATYRIITDAGNGSDRLCCRSAFSFRYPRIFKPAFVLIFLVCLFFQVISCTQKKLPDDKPINDLSYDQLIETAQVKIDNRNHSEAIELLNAAGRKAPDRPEWAYEQARAQFFMGRFAESAQSCSRALNNDPEYYEAMAFRWAARLQAAGLAKDAKEIVRSEIEALLQGTRTTQALLTAYAGYTYLKDEPAQQQVILELVTKLDTIGPEQEDEIAANLFEQIIGARDPSERDVKLQLMEAYAHHFPENRFADYLVYRMLQEKSANEENIDFEAILQSDPAFESGSWRQKTGAARWLIEQEVMAGKAAELLRESLATAEQALKKRPPYFTETLWQKERAKELDRIHLFLGRAGFTAGDYDLAEAEFAPLAAKKRNWSDVYHYLGMIARARQDYDRAIGWFRQALEMEQRADSEEAIAELLKEYRDYVGEPALYFSQISSTVSFADVTNAAGLADVRASRVAWGDYDGDGFPDLLLDGHRLFRNTGTGKFLEVTGEAGLGSIEKANGGIWGDYDNDGAIDIFVTSWSGNRLFRNNANGTFLEKTAEAFGPMEGQRTEAAAWGDLDNDGDLDLYAANYEKNGVMRAIGTHDRMYRNNGDGTFTDISSAAGVKPNEAMCGRGVVWTDLNGDGNQEIVVANYRLDPNFCWVNRQENDFSDAADTFGMRGYNVAGAFGHSIGPVSGDLNNDGRIDLFVSNLAHPRYIEFSDQNMVLLNEGPPEYRFTDTFFESGIAFEETNSDPVLADVDNDGDLDLYISSIYPGRYSHLYLNDGRGRFSDVSWQSRTRVENSWGTGFADFDNDGFPDLLVASKDGVRLFHNNGNRNHWVKVKIDDACCNRLGIGSRISVSYDGRCQIREIVAGRGTGSQDEPAAVFGFGGYAGPVTIQARTLCGDDLQTTIDSTDWTVTLKH